MVLLSQAYNPYLLDGMYSPTRNYQHTIDLLLDFDNPVHRFVEGNLELQVLSLSNQVKDRKDVSSRTL